MPGTATTHSPRRVRTCLTTALIAALLSACAGLPRMFTEPMPDAPDIAAVSAAPQSHVGERVRWRGVFLTARQIGDNGLLELVDDARAPARRFFVQLPGGAPSGEQPGRELTVVGRLAEPLREEIGGRVSHFAVIEVESSEQLLWHTPATRWHYANQPLYHPYLDFPWYRCERLSGGYWRCR